jgi:hypothetical protein
MQVGTHHFEFHEFNCQFPFSLALNRFMHGIPIFLKAKWFLEKVKKGGKKKNRNSLKSSLEIQPRKLHQPNWESIEVLLFIKAKK